MNYTVSGSAGAGDYTALTGSVAIAAGAQTAVINVAGIVDDALLEGNETVTVTLLNTGTAGVGVDATPATVTIADNETATVTLSANDAAASEAGSDPGQFTVDLGTLNNTGAAITVNYTVSGSAGAGDYTALTGSVAIAAGAQTAVINVAGIVDDALLEGNETVTVTLLNTGTAGVGVDATPATVTIADNETATVTLSANDAAASEAGSDPGQFTVDLGTLNNTGAAITVNYTVSGSAGAGDYTALTGSVAIAAGAQTAVINVAGIVDDALLEGNETVTVTLLNTGTAGVGVDATPATVTIADNETATVTLSANDAAAAEAGSDPGQFTVDLGTINNTGAAITVNYTVSGSAGAGTDYTALTGSVAIAAGAQTAVINVAGIVDDALLEGNETVTVTLAEHRHRRGGRGRHPGHRHHRRQRDGHCHAQRQRRGRRRSRLRSGPVHRRPGHHQQHRRRDHGELHRQRQRRRGQTTPRSPAASRSPPAPRPRSSTSPASSTMRCSRATRRSPSRC